MDVQEKLSVSCGKMAKPARRHRHYTYRPRLGKVLIDPNTGTRYVLLEIIGKNVHTQNHNSFDLIYKACYYDCSNKDSLLPSDYATMKFIRPRLNIDWPTVVGGKSTPNSKIINIDKWVIQKFNQGIVVTLPYMSEGSLCYILSIRFWNRLSEGCIAIALKQALLGLIEIHNLGMVHKRFSAGNIYVNFKQRPIWNAEITLGFAATIYNSELESPRPKNPSNPELWAAAPKVFYSKYDAGTGHSDIWLVSVAALKLAYENLRISDRKDFEGLIKKIKRSKKLPDKLKDVLEEIKIEEGEGKTQRFLKAFNNKLKYVKTERKSLRSWCWIVYVAKIQRGHQLDIYCRDHFFGMLRT